jgi:serine/threonine-protein kinase
MEYVEGPTLRQVIDAEHGMSLRRALRIAAEIADALDAAHRAGLVHRDVKPANVLVPDGGGVKVTDFGIAKAVGVDDLTRTGTVMGTARYLAPEQINGRPTDPRTDVYALGLLLYEMLCGHPPFGGDTDIATAMARLTTTAAPIRDERPDVPPALDDVVHRCLARDPAARYASAGAVRDALAVVAGGGAAPLPARAPGARLASAPRVAASPDTTGPHTLEPSVPVAAARGHRSRRAWAVVGTVLLVVAATVAAFALHNSGGTNSPTTTSASRPLTLVAAHDFDPLGDGQEDPSQVDAVRDGNLATTWQTENYVDFHRDKAGVGIYLQLDGTHAVHSVSVVTVESGWSAQIYVAGQPATTLAGWGSARATATTVPSTHTFTIDGARGRYVLLWLTMLAGDSPNQHLHVAEITIR